MGCLGMSDMRKILNSNMMENGVKLINIYEGVAQLIKNLFG